MNWIDEVRWNDDGLVCAIAQETGSGKVLMQAWMNREALERSVALGEAVYWSRSRNRLWHKGEESGHTQKIRAMRLDCDGDTILLEVEQIGGIACHTGRHDCFFRRLDDGAWLVEQPVIKDPHQIYAK